MRTSVFLLLFLCFLPVTWGGEIYSCRDSQGQLHLSDNPLDLPEACRATAVRTAPEAENFTIVPAVLQKSAPSGEVEQAVREVEEKIESQQQRLAQYRQRATALVRTYRQVLEEKRSAKRRWTYNSRKIIAQANEQIERLKGEKRDLLLAVTRDRMSLNEKDELIFILAQIED